MNSLDIERSTSSKGGRLNTLDSRFASKAKPCRLTNSLGSLMQAANFGMWLSTSAVYCMHRSAKTIMILFLTCIHQIIIAHLSLSNPADVASGALKPTLLTLEGLLLRC